jgi:hypothetical protein
MPFFGLLEKQENLKSLEWQKNQEQLDFYISIKFKAQIVWLLMLLAMVSQR